MSSNDDGAGDVGDGEGRAVRRERQRPVAAGCGGQVVAQRPPVDVPDPQRAVLGRRRQQRSVRRELDVEHGAEVRVEDLDAARRRRRATWTVKSCDVAASSVPSGEKSTTPWKNEHPVTFSSSPPNDVTVSPLGDVGDGDRVVPHLGADLHADARSPAAARPARRRRRRRCPPGGRTPPRRAVRRAQDAHGAGRHAHRDGGAVGRHVDAVGLADRVAVDGADVLTGRRGRAAGSSRSGRR